MRILHCTFSLGCGGVETLLVSLANRQAREHRVEVCTLTPPRETDIARRNLSGEIVQSHLGKRNMLSGFGSMARLARKLRKGKYDIVHIHGQLYYYIAAVLTAPHSTRFVYTVHNDAAREDSRWDRIFTGLKRRWFASERLAAVVISRESERSFIEYYGSEIPHTLIVNGIEPPAPPQNDTLEQWRVSASTRVFINPGRLYIQKNQKQLCESFAELLRRGHDVQLIIAGTREQEEIFRSIEPYLCERIKYVGERDNLPQMLACADAMILPSLWEGMPIALLECLATGCIPLCTRIGGMADVVDSQAGIAIASPDAEDITKAAEIFLEKDAEEIKALRAASQAAFAPYSIDACSESYLRLYGRLNASQTVLSK